MTITPTPTWEKAIRRAIARGLKATLRADGTFRVASVSTPGTFHTVKLNAAGRIIECDCKGWTRYGRTNPCQHSGAVAVALVALKGRSLETASVPAVDLGVTDFRPGKSQLFRTVAA
jgi:hypothetical protein